MASGSDVSIQRWRQDGRGTLLGIPPRTPMDVDYGEDMYEHVTPGLVYIETACPGPGIDEELFNSTPEGCGCGSVCEDGACPCIARSRAAAQEESAFECNSSCQCYSSCRNRVTQRGPRRGLKVIPLGEKGLGVVTERYIPKGAFVCEYAGEVIGVEEAGRRLKARQSSEANYILVLQEHVAGGSRVQTTVIDPTVLGNIGRYLNHSCDPNLRVVPVRVHSLIPIAAFFALKPISSLDELCYDYDSVASPLDPGDSQNTPPQLSGVNLSPKACLCRTEKCRGFLPFDPHLL